MIAVHRQHTQETIGPCCRERVSCVIVRCPRVCSLGKGAVRKTVEHALVWILLASQEHQVFQRMGHAAIRENL